MRISLRSRLRFRGPGAWNIVGEETFRFFRIAGSGVLSGNMPGKIGKKNAIVESVSGKRVVRS